MNPESKGGQRGKEQPKVSVIVPVYKVEPYLRKCLDSLLAQTYENLEIILVDDGSPDNCPAICDEYAETDSRIKVIHKENGGVSSARNAGLSAAAGEWIGWVDSDDWVEPDMFAYLVSNALKSDADLAVCSRFEEYGDRAVFKGWESTAEMDTEESLRYLLEDGSMQNYLWDKLWKRELFSDIRFPEGRTFEDIAVMHRLFLRAGKLVCLEEAKYHYRQRPGSIVANVSLGNRLNCYTATLQRYEDLKNGWPQFECLVASHFGAAVVSLWASYYGSPKEERGRYLPKLREISDFYRKEEKTIRKSIKLGLAGRLVLRLVPHPKGWAFRLARVVGRLYEKKHGRAL